MFKYKKSLKLNLLICLLIVLFVVGCSSDDNGQLEFISFPERVTEGESFNVKGEYLTVKPEKKEVTVILNIKEIGNENSLKTKEKNFQNESQNFEFSELVVNNIKNDIYFEFKLIIDSNYIQRVDTTNNLSYVANWHTDIKTTYFNDRDEDGNPLYGAWGNDLTEENPFYYALPYRPYYQGMVYQDYNEVKNKWIEIRYCDGEDSESIYAQWVDVGPWNVYDPYYVFSKRDERPYAETGIDMGWSGEHRETNKAGLDISPTAMEYLGKQVEGDFIEKGIVELDWRFVDEDEVPVGPWLYDESTEEANPEEFNLETETLRNRN
ncbi:hypothetical protein [Natroniella sp. ANB-PHB2]|uniref:hypothetical protein n=1 Tax=Natroniella sp. ANB-PHB2 TaxID=3384444 RepID=UPI0038D3AD6E